VLGGSIAYVCAQGDPARVERALRKSPLAPDFLTSVDDVLESPDVTTVTRTYGVLRVIGIGTGAFSLLALLLYLQARERSQLIANAFSRRMGMAPRAQAASLALEAAALVLFATVLGTVSALVAAAPLISHVDPLPQLPPSPTLIVPWISVLVALTGVTAIAALVGAGTSLAAGRRDVTEALRVA
jgi:FtsX-like permease family